MTKIKLSPMFLGRRYAGSRYFWVQNLQWSHIFGCKIWPFIRTPPYINIASTPWDFQASTSCYTWQPLFIKSENHFNNYMEAIHGVENYNKTEAKHIVAEAAINNGTQHYRITLLKILLPSDRICTWSWMNFERVDKILWILLPLNFTHSIKVFGGG